MEENHGFLRSHNLGMDKPIKIILVLLNRELNSLSTGSKIKILAKSIEKLELKNWG